MSSIDRKEAGVSDRDADFGLVERVATSSTASTSSSTTPGSPRSSSCSRPLRRTLRHCSGSTFSASCTASAESRAGSWCA